MHLNCTRCGLHRWRKNIVIGRGMVPASIMMIGEAPGKSENVRGIPFVGPAGKILNLAIVKSAAIAKLEKLPDIFITNVVRCRPCDGKLEPNRQPTKDEVMSCREWLEESYERVKPKFVVFLGKVAENYCRSLFPGGIALQHPAYILRQGGVASPHYRKFVRELSEVFRKAEEEK